ncbi:MAG TPA: flagellar biosynthesis anti-sigma factor FlgM [Gammaproteobacteria bacterium]|nr:flagellar biosynthesis anti-sigma factor FlgM [Gammaproteobacteria bacterium]
MAIEINGNVTAQLSNAKDSAKAQLGRNDPNVSKLQAGQPQTGDTVTLTDTAEQLRKIEHLISKMPVVDISRVERVKKALTTGQYDFNTDRVADKLMRFESGITRHAA